MLRSCEVFTLLITTLILLHFGRTQEVQENLAVIEDYLQKICDHTPTCNITTTLPQKYQTLKVRGCMCDSDCVRYRDCCADSSYISNHPPEDEYDFNFKCVEGILDDVYMVSKCPSSWNQSQSVIDNCHSEDVNILNVDILLSTPVTTASNFTYKNMFCAICHQQDTFSFWTLQLTYAPLANLSNAVNTQNSFSIDEILTNISFGDYVTFEINNVTYEVFINSVPPANLVYHVRYCVANSINNCSQAESETEEAEKCTQNFSYTLSSDSVYRNPSCLACNNLSITNSICHKDRGISKGFFSETFEVDITDKRIVKVPIRCEQMPTSLFAYNLFCPKPKQRTRKNTKQVCFLRRPDTNLPCLLDKYYTINLTKIIDNSTLYFIQLDTTYPKEEWNANTTHVYICGTYLNKTAFKEMMEVIEEYLTSVLIKISMICLILHLLLFQQLPELKNLSGKNLASFCGTLFIALFCFDIGPWLPSCKVTAAIAHYAFLSCFTWMLVMAYDCWLSLYRATAKFRSAGGKHRLKFFIYCTLSWMLPLTIIAPSVYIEWSESVGCEYKLGYGVSKDCFIFNKNSQYLLFYIPATVLFVGVLCFFGHTAYILYTSQKNTVNPNSRRDFQVYTRLALLMGLTWTLGSVVGLVSNPFLSLLFSVLNMSQGVFIFFAFTYKKKFLRSLMNKYEGNRFVSATLSSFVGPETVTSSANTQTRV